MLVQVDYKRQLVGSTIAQMGFMLIQCALGAYLAAIIHAVLHGLFKSTLFLQAGSAIHHDETLLSRRLTNIAIFMDNHWRYFRSPSRDWFLAGLSWGKLSIDKCLNLRVVCVFSLDTTRGFWSRTYRTYCRIFFVCSSCNCVQHHSYCFLSIVT